MKMHAKQRCKPFFFFLNKNKQKQENPGERETKQNLIQITSFLIFLKRIVIKRQNHLLR